MVGIGVLDSFRRCTGTELLRAGHDLATVADYLGHASLSTTRLYDCRGHAQQREAVATLAIPVVVRRAAGGQP